MKKRGRFKIKTWQLLLVLIPLLFLCATMLRANHIKMTELRDAVLAADEKEDDEEIAKTLEELKQYVFHEVVINIVDDNGGQKIMFGTGPFYLEHSYIRAANKALEEAEAKMASGDNPNGNVYGKAGEVCRALAIQNGWSWNNANFINCMLTEIQKYPAADEIQDTIIASLPSTELYRKNYASPIFTFSATGLVIVLIVLIIVVIIIRFFIWVILRISLFFV